MRPRWLRWLGVATSVVAVAMLAWIVMPPGPPDTPAVPTCFTPPAPPDLPVTNSSDADAALRQANQLAADRRFDLARTMYETIAKDDPRGMAGLAFLEAQRNAAQKVAASAQRMVTAEDPGADACFQSAIGIDPSNETARSALTLDTRSLPMRAVDRWNTFASRVLAPLGEVILPTLGGLVVLLIVVRFLVPRLAPPRAEAWPDWVVRTAWWAGLALIAICVARTIVLLGFPARTSERFDAGWRHALQAGLITTAGLVAVLARTTRRVRKPTNGGWNGPAYLRTAALIVAAVLLPVCIAGVASSSSAPAWWPLHAGEWPLPPGLRPWLVTGAVLLPGLVLHAAGRGHALRLRVDVKAGETADVAGTAYVLGRLQELGSSPPRGLKVPQQVDVTDLPTEALTSLPAGKVASAVTSTINLLLPSVPWRATVQDAEGGRLSVTITRNGVVAETAVVDPSLFLAAPGPSVPTSSKEPAAEVTDPPQQADRSHLLTAAAAVILTQLSAAHRPLQAGLCGATRWDSVAAYVVSTRPQDNADDDVLRASLLAFAVETDPCNALARTAYVLGMDKSDRGGEPAKASRRRLQDLVSAIDEQYETEASELRYGFEPLRLRVRHFLLAVMVNTCADERERTGSVTAESAKSAREAYDRFRDLLEAEPGDQRTFPFVRDLRAVLAPLYEGLSELGIAGGLVEPRPDWTVAAAMSSLSFHYDRACTAVLEKDYSQALDDLEIAAGDRRLLTAARTDPSLHALRQPGQGVHEEHWTRFWAIVGEPASTEDLTHQPLFAPHGEALRTLGIDGAQSLAAATDGDHRRWQLANRLDVLRETAERWRSIAELAQPRETRTRWLDDGELALLLAVGLRCPADLDSKTRDAKARQALRAEIDRQRSARNQRGLSDAEFHALVGSA